jgi:hypothetical protein
VRDSVVALKGHILEVHLTDVDAQGKAAPFGSGVTDGGPVLQELGDEKFKGIFAVQVTADSAAEKADRFVQAINAFSDIVTTVSGVKE